MYARVWRRPTVKTPIFPRWNGTNGWNCRTPHEQKMGVFTVAVTMNVIYLMRESAYITPSNRKKMNKAPIVAILLLLAHASMGQFSDNGFWYFKIPLSS